jgi:hypothetical protein
MTSTNVPRIEAETPGPAPLTLGSRWSDGGESAIYIAAPVNTYRLHQKLRHEPALFGQVHFGEYGADVVWEDGIDMAADQLWHLALEQGTALAQRFHAA